MAANELYKKHITGHVANDSTLYREYAALTKEEITQFIAIAIADRSLPAEGKINVFLYLVLFAYGCGEQLPAMFYDYLLEQKVYYYSELYLRADAKAAQALIQCLSGPVENSLEVDHILSCIAQIPCRESLDFLQTSSNQPLPKWAKKLHVLPIAYTTVGGWCPGANGGIRQLFSKEVIAFESCDKTAAASASSLTPLAEVCRYCHQPLTLVFSGQDKLATCLYCSCYETIFVKQTGAQIQWHVKNAPSDFFKENFEKFTDNDEEITQRFDFGLKLSGEQKKYTYTAHQFATVPLTQIGGLPTRINEVNYPFCPDCGQQMVFAAQLDMGDVEQYGEGLYYFFTCSDCGVHACNYDQT